MGVLKTGIIGCGKVGDFHAKAYAGLEESSFTAVCDVSRERAEALAAKYGVKAYTDVREMCEKEKLDVVSVCTPHPLHAKAAVAAAECGCNVLIEKPLASSLADCDAIIEAGDKAGVNELVIEIIDRLNGLEPEGDHRVPALAGDGDHALGPEGVAVHDEGLDDLGHGFALRAVEHGLLFRGEFQAITSFLCLRNGGRTSFFHMILAVQTGKVK